ncbi:siderophore-interacting protein [Salinimonas marina]|uniref:Siderophore-interacting protein n=1 Tax=Salinimonas marina TaxID=2785918 RepID=A0A7S9HC23_9ALTE|nr:siderophore-interacting protein [Salinimonas marina]QPG04836.1 siderophore-interacting protein [Salinimonas marina]
MAPKIRMTQVKAIHDISPHMRRVVLTGEALSDFPVDRKSAHVKAIFPDPGAANKLPRLGAYAGFKTWMRSYTIREFDPKTQELWLDFAIFDHQGLASNWAQSAMVGDYLGIAGPGDVKHPKLGVDNHLLIGDLTALPVIAATLEMLPEQATGSAFIQVPTHKDIQTLNKPAGIAVEWLVTENKKTERFLSTLSAQKTTLTDTSILIAAEASIVKQLKSYLKEHCEYSKKNLYASAYWNSKK